METCWEFIMKETERRYYCVICGCDIFGTPHNAKQHFYGERHADSLDMYGGNISLDEGRYQYYCDLCECSVSGYTNVRGHITGQRHKNFLETSEDESDTSDENEQYVRMNSDDFVLRYTDTDEYICFLCNKEIKSTWSCHVLEWNHRENFRIYGSEILSSESGWYYCQLCDCYMCSWKNVYAHINGGRHENNM